MVAETRGRGQLQPPPPTALRVAVLTPLIVRCPVRRLQTRLRRQPHALVPGAGAQGVLQLRPERQRPGPQSRRPGLDAETTLSFDLSLRHQTDDVRSALNAYLYNINNFIYANRTDQIVGILPVLQFTQGNSR